jgi:EamA domain-containing membrane protein RarD
MFKRFTNDLQHYLPLIGIFSMGIVGFVMFSYDTMFQIALAIAIGFSYIIWGLVHHKMHNDLHFSIFIEYLVIAVLGTSVIISLVLHT